MSDASLARIEAVRGLLREAERAARAMAEDVDPVDQPVSVEVIDSLADMDPALDRVDARWVDSAVRHARLLPRLRPSARPPRTPGWGFSSWSTS